MRNIRKDQNANVTLPDKVGWLMIINLGTFTIYVSIYSDHPLFTTDSALRFAVVVGRAIYLPAQMFLYCP